MLKNEIVAIDNLYVTKDKQNLGQNNCDCPSESENLPM